METKVEPVSTAILSRPEDEHPRIHAKKLDKALGFRIPRIEEKLRQKYRAYDRCNDESNRKQHYKGTQTWIGLHPQVLQTPYCDILDALLLIKNVEIKHVVDIGAGYGRVGIVLSALFPKAKFTGFEILKQRQTEANRVFKKLGIVNSEIKHENVLDADFEMPEADIYFIYDFSELDDVFYVLENLSLKASEKPIFLITRGDRIDYIMKHQFKKVWNLYQTLKTSDLKIYSSIHNK